MWTPSQTITQNQKKNKKNSNPTCQDTVQPNSYIGNHRRAQSTTTMSRSTICILTPTTQVNDLELPHAQVNDPITNQRPINEFYFFHGRVAKRKRKVWLREEKKWFRRGLFGAFRFCTCHVSFIRLKMEDNWWKVNWRWAGPDKYNTSRPYMLHAKPKFNILYILESSKGYSGE